MLKKNKSLKLASFETKKCISPMTFLTLEQQIYGGTNNFCLIIPVFGPEIKLNPPEM